MIKPYPYDLCNQLNQYFSFQLKKHEESYYTLENVSISNFLNLPQSIKRNRTNIGQKSKKLLFFCLFFYTIHSLIECYPVPHYFSCIFINFQCICKNCSPNQIKFQMCSFTIQPSNTAYYLLCHTNCTKFLSITQFKDHQVLKLLLEHAS